MTPTITDSDTLHRALKLALDSGEAASVGDARRQFERYRLDIRVGADVALSPTLQAALLTAVNCGRRCFLGGVRVGGDLTAPLRVPWSMPSTLGEAVVALGASCTTAVKADGPVVVVGHASPPPGAEVALQVTFDGWSGGVIPYAERVRLDERREFTPSGVLAGAMAVSEAFQSVRGDAVAGCRPAGVSLWRPERDWRTQDSGEPPLRLLPSDLWLLGLGHLGQAFLWTIGMLPYVTPTDLHLVLQDFDRLVAANDSTSPLTRVDMVGMQKTRAMADWCEARGFRTSLVERPFAADFRVNDREPRLALCGVDNALARAALEEVGFQRVVEAGLGRGVEEYLAFQIHTFPASRTARECWRASGPAGVDESLLKRPAYAALAREGLDRCGLINLAGRAVGASFVGTAVSTLVIAEVLRTLVGGRRYELIDGNLRSPARCAAIAHGTEGAPFNPGSTSAVTARSDGRPPDYPAAATAAK